MKPWLIAWIWLVTAYDIYCCGVLTASGELNPIARYILVHYGMWKLLGLKVFGTYLATEWLRHLPTYFSVIIALAMAGLLWILLC